MDWKDSLSALLNSGALPQDPVESANEKGAPDQDKANEKGARKKGVVNVIYERKGRGGKPATILECRDLSDEQTAALAKKLKSSLAVGGSARDNEILLQGDQRSDRLRALLTREGLTIKGL